jgi:hypothetical protein
MSGHLMYVKFDEKTGKILGISPQQEEKENSIPVQLSEVRSLIEGKESRRNYKVEYDTKSKKLELKHKHIYSFDGSNINDFIYEIPTQYVDEPDISIEHNILENCWKVRMTTKLKQNLDEKNIKLNQNLNFSVTKKHDPNVLYKTFSISLSDILRNICIKVPFTADFEYTDAPVSLFTSRKFDTYVFSRVTNEQ